MPLIFKVFFLLKLKRIKCCPIPYRLPSGSSANLTARRGAPSLTGWTGWTGGRVDGLTGGRSPKVSFNFFHFKIY